MAAVLKKRALAEFSQQQPVIVSTDNQPLDLVKKESKRQKISETVEDIKPSIQKLKEACLAQEVEPKLCFLTKNTTDEQVKLILNSEYIYGHNIADDLNDLFKRVLKEKHLYEYLPALVDKLLITIREEEESITKSSYFTCLKELIKIKEFEDNVNLIKLAEELVQMIGLFSKKLVIAELLSTLQKIIEKPTVKLPMNLNQSLIAIVKKLLISKRSHLVKSRGLILLANLAPIESNASQNILNSNNLESMNQQSECLNIIKTLRDYSKYYDSRVRSSALLAILQLHNRGFKLDISLYCEFCDALKDDYEGCRVVAIQLLEVLSTHYSDCLVCVDKGDEQIRLIDDAFAKICSMINDLSVDVRTQAGNVLGNFQSVSPDFLEQTLDKKLMSNLRMKKSAHERNRESFKAGEWSSGKKWADDAPQGDIQPEMITLMGIGACGAFIHGLEDEFMQVRMATLNSISKLAELFPNYAKQALDFLVDMLNDEIEDIRLIAIHCLGKACQKEIILREDQIEIILPVLKDSSSHIRESLHIMIGKCKVSSRLSLKSCIDNLLEDLKRYPEDRASIWKCFQMLGKNHSKFLPSLIQELLGIHPFLDLQEPSLEDHLYIGVLICVINGAAYSKEIIKVFEKYKVFSRHYTYLRDLTPELIPIIKELDNELIDANNSICSLIDQTESDEKENKNMELFLLNVFERIKNSIESSDQGLETQLSIIRLSINDLQRISTIEKTMSNAAEFAKCYLECQMLLRALQNDHNWINAFSATSSLQSSSLRSSIHQTLLTSFKLIHQFHGLHPKQFGLVLEMRVRTLAIQLIAVIHGSNASALTLCDAFLEEVFALKRHLEIHCLKCDKLTMDVIDEVSILKQPKPGLVARNLKPLFLSSKTLQNTSDITELMNNEIIKNFKLSNLKKSYAILDGPKERTETPLKFTSGLILTLRLDARLYNIKDIKNVRVKIHFADKQTNLVLPRLSDFRSLNVDDEDQAIQSDSLVNDYRLQTNLYISHGVWSDPCFVEISLVLDFRESLSSASSVSQIWALKSTPSYKLKVEESLMIQLCSPCKILISPKAHIKGIL